MYEPVTDSWSQKASLPKASGSDPDGYPAVVDNQLIFFTYFGGALRVISYNPKTDKWSKVKQDRNSSSFGSATTVATSGRFTPQRIYVLSGGSTIFFKPTSYVAAYDPLSGTWEQAMEDPTPRVNFGVAVLDDILYVIGGTVLGTAGQEASSVNEQYVPIGYSSTFYNELFSNEFPSSYLIVVALVLTVGVVGGLILYFKKRKMTRENIVKGTV
jgi:hypothetical protein